MGYVQKWHRAVVPCAIAPGLLVQVVLKENSNSFVKQTNIYSLVFLLYCSMYIP